MRGPSPQRIATAPGARSHGGLTLSAPDCTTTSPVSEVPKG